MWICGEDLHSHVNSADGGWVFDNQALWRIFFFFFYLKETKLFNEYLIFLQVIERSWDYKLSIVSLFLRGFFAWFDCLQSNGTTEHQVESFIRKKLESLLKESQIRDKEDPDSFTVRALLKATHEGLNAHLKQVDNSYWTRKDKTYPLLCFLSIFPFWSASQTSVSTLIKFWKQTSSSEWERMQYRTASLG